MTTVELKALMPARTTANDPLWAFATAYKWAELGYIPRDPITAFVLAYEGAALSAMVFI